MGKHLSIEEKRLSVLMFKMKTYVERVMHDLAIMYPELTELSGFASLELKRYMMLAYINGALETEETRDLTNFIDELHYSIEHSKSMDDLDKNTIPPCKNI